MNPIARVTTEAAFVAVFVLAPLAWTALSLANHATAAEVIARYAVYAAVLLGAWRLRAVSRERSVAPGSWTVRDSQFALAALGVSAVAIAFGLRWLFFHPGIPVLLHDWSWPISRDELRHLASVTTADWSAIGFGAPKAYPTLYTLYVPASAAGFIVGPHATLSGMLLLFGCVGGTSLAILLHRTCGIGRGGALLGAAAYVASPFLVDELGAGHLANVAAYGLLPAVCLVAANAGPSLRSALASGFGLGALVAISVAQIQYAYFDAVAVGFALTIAKQRRETIAVLAATATCVVIAAHGQSFYHLTLPERHGGAAVDASPRAWFDLLSSTTLAVLGQSGYIGTYADRARLLPGVWDATLLGAVGWAIAGYALRFGGPAGAAFCALVIAGIVGATGVHGPFAAIKLGLSTFRSTTAFREAYNFQALTTLGLAGCAAFAFGHARTSRAALAMGALAVAVVAVGAFPFVSGRLRAQMHVWHEDVGYANARAIVAASPRDDGRVAMLPLAQPIRQDGYNYGGTEIYGSGFAGAPVVAEWRPEAELATADLLLRAGDPADGVRLLGRLGVRRVLLRYDLVSDLPNYWFPKTFPADWSTRASYRALERTTQLRLRARSTRVATYDVVPYEPRLGFAHAVRTCDGISPLAVLASTRPTDQRCAGTAPAMTRALDLEPSAESYDPSKAWIESRKVFSLGTAFAEHGDSGLATIGPALLERRFAAAIGDRLAIDCIARGTLAYSLNDATFRPLSCATDVTGIPKRTVLNDRLSRENRLWIQNAGSPALVAAMATGPAFPRALQTAYVSVGDTLADGSRITYERVGPTALRGTIDAARSAAVVLSDAYDDRWRLHLSPGAVLRSERANVDENLFVVPSGRYRFELTFDTSMADRVLGALQWLTWPVVLLALIALGFPRRANARSHP